MKSIIEDFSIGELKNSKFINSKLVKFKQNGIQKSWEIVEAFDSVAILIFHREKKAFILVKQFRPAVYMKNKDGMTIELCAGIIDKDLSLEEIAREEVFEECGYLVSSSDIQRITSVNSAVGFAGSKQTLFYVEVDEVLHVTNGGGVENELIEVIELPVSKVKEFMYDESITKTTGLLFALMWWLDRFDSI